MMILFRFLPFRLAVMLLAGVWQTNNAWAEDLKPTAEPVLEQELAPVLIDTPTVEEPLPAFEHGQGAVFSEPAAEEAASHDKDDDCGSGLDIRYLSRIDRMHDRISDGLCLPSRWFDRFFAKPGLNQDEEAGTFLRVIATGNLQEDGNENNDLRVRAKVDLPNMEERLTLVLRNDDDISEDGRDISAASPGSTQDNAFQAALRWISVNKANHDVDLEAGFRSGIKTFVRGRYRWQTLLPGDKWGFRFTESVYWKDTIGVGSETRLDFERPLSRRVLLRLSSRAEINEEMQEQGDDFDLTQYSYFYFWLSRQSAIELYGGARARTAPNTYIHEYRSGIRLRQNVWRKWFFVELEPYVFWPREYDYQPVHGVVLRLESQFGDY